MDPSTDRARVKEADRPPFPPEQSRNWRVQVRDAVVAASGKPERLSVGLKKPGHPNRLSRT